MNVAGRMLSRWDGSMLTRSARQSLATITPGDVAGLANGRGRGFRERSLDLLYHHVRETLRKVGYEESPAHSVALSATWHLIAGTGCLWKTLGAKNGFALGNILCSGRRQMARAVPGQRPVVLVVEDEGLIRSSAMAMVEEAGFEAIEASDADEAIRILESRNDIRAVFTDVNMPGSMDGLRLARVVRNRWPPVALIVASGHTNVLESDLPTGGRFLSKPYGLREVGAALQQLVTWHR
jgi:CheY-like chemotaxis protein